MHYCLYSPLTSSSFWEADYFLKLMQLITSHFNWNKFRFSTQLSRVSHVIKYQFKSSEKHINNSLIEHSTAQSIRDFFFDFLLKWPSFRFKLPFYFSTWALKGIWSQYNFISLTFRMKNREKNNEMPIWRTVKFYWKAIFIANINFLPTRFSSQSKTTTWNGIFLYFGTDTSCSELLIFQ